MNGNSFNWEEKNVYVDPFEAQRLFLYHFCPHDDAKNIHNLITRITLKMNARKHKFMVISLLPQKNHIYVDKKICVSLKDFHFWLKCYIFWN